MTFIELPTSGALAKVGIFVEFLDCQSLPFCLSVLNLHFVTLFKLPTRGVLAKVSIFVEFMDFPFPFLSYFFG